MLLKTKIRTKIQNYSLKFMPNMFLFSGILYKLVLPFPAGYLHIIQQMKELIEGAGKKSYTLVMGRPNSAKLANFPEVITVYKLRTDLLFFIWLWLNYLNQNSCFAV